MIAAFAVFAGFLYWLNGQAAEERALELVEDSASAIVDEYAAAIPVTAADIMLDASPYAGQLVRLEPQTVASLLGQQGFFLDLSAGPFLVSLSDELRAANLGIASQSVVRVTGRITPMTEEVAAGWQAAGTISEGEAFAATVSVYYLEAEEVQVSAPAPAGGA
jgi:hypothetical protein